MKQNLIIFCCIWFLTLDGCSSILDFEGKRDDGLDFSEEQDILEDERFQDEWPNDTTTEFNDILEFVADDLESDAFQACDEWTTISCGNIHTCAITSTGEVKCWGDNEYGQLGDGTIINRATPVIVDGLTSNISTIDCGGFHTCAITTVGGVKCWGDNSVGQLGDGTRTRRTTPVDVFGLTSGVAAVATGGTHTCALLFSGGLKCWGNNRWGQLGDGTTTYKPTPVDVLGLTSGVVFVFSGGMHTCAVISTGALKCWGYNTYGGLGDGTTTERHTPVDVLGLTSGVSSVSGGDCGTSPHTCALLSSGDVKCWGWNAAGEIGDGTTTERLTPVDVLGLTSGVSTISAGCYHSCALLSTGGVVCWGENDWGQIGDGTTIDSTLPVDVSGLGSGVSSFSSNGEHNCALFSTGNVKCWGSNSRGQLGNGRYGDINSIPVDVICPY